MRPGFFFAISLCIAAYFVLRESDILPWKIVDAAELSAMQNELTRLRNQDNQVHVARGAWMWNRRPGELDRGPYNRF